MGLDSLCFDGIDTERPCSVTEGCEEIAVVHVLDQEFDSGRTFPFCFRHAFVYALGFDPEAQALAITFAVDRGIKASRGVAANG